ncbi:BZ3500_MvSof-1268-A1-R1_Chr2-3g05383 [Microbotryum saponariae]|uniref:BZ3500_MvSof-1268-A1-R1_Chr2-3g05383 protein n=1 Tax=Microbotryum saponariae TaxID=289078 RepID=A0A2X0MA29_9BASI|nr:BZ3500_MvSof-1268-A1-R1_Chr2-3g05383 [Microbotryum saponariae]SDA01328.1 BZ3501_MvSof-1269-A2-R1_Chr2-2g05056 [Microbotryum saponariae]
MNSIPSSTPPTSPPPVPTKLGRARSASRTFSEAQADLDQQRQQDSLRARAMDHLDEMPGLLTRPGVGKGIDGGGEGITPGEFRAEMETLLLLRRRSLSQPTTVDPDLPPPTSPTGANHPYMHSPPGSPTSPTFSSTSKPSLSIQITKANQLGPSGNPVSPTAPTAAETGTLVRRRSSAAGTRPMLPLPSDHPLPPPISSASSSGTPSMLAPLAVGIPSSSAPASSSPPPSPTALYDGRSAAHASQELFWLPASLHPELAPQEFKAFIREQTRPDNLARRTSLSAAAGRGIRSTGARTSSLGATLGDSVGRLDRRKSMLRGEYKPRTDDGVGEASSEGPTSEPKRLSRGKSEGAFGSGSQGSRRTSGRINFDELTISDLQRLEELAARAEAEAATEGEGEGERLGRVLRRSLSLNPSNLVAQAYGSAAHSSTDVDFDGLASLSSAGGASGATDERSASPVPALDDDASAADSPLLVHSPGQILRRSARTKIRKAGLIGDGNGHRFGPSRRQRVTSNEWATNPSDEAQGESSFESSESLDEKGSAEWSETASAGTTIGGPSFEGSLEGVSSSSGHQSVVSTASIAEPQYIEDVAGSGLSAVPRPEVEAAELSVASVTSKPLDAPLPPTPPKSDVSLAPIASGAPAVDPSSADFDWATHASNLQQAKRPPLVATPSIQAPGIASIIRTDTSSPQQQRYSQPAAKATPPPTATKEKKSGWARLGLSVRSGAATMSSSLEEKKRGKGAQPTNSAPQQPQREAFHVQDGASFASQQQQQQQEKDSGFFGGLFGKKKHDHETGNGANPGVSGMMSKPSGPPTPPLQSEVSNRMAPPPPPPTATAAQLPTGEYVNFYRLPIHVERAVYRLSHIKLANPRRPLYEQVLISNLMFWYLSIINRPSPPPVPVPVPVPLPPPGPARGPLVNGVHTPDESDGSSTSGSADSSPSASPVVQASPAQPTPKRGTLTKSGAGNRSSPREVAIKPARYEQQNRQIDQEYLQQQQQQQQQHQQHQQHQQQHAPPRQSQAQPVSFAPIVVDSSKVENFGSSNAGAPPSPQRSPDRSSAPADMYSFSNGTAGAAAQTVSWSSHSDDHSSQGNPARRSSPPVSPSTSPNLSSSSSSTRTFPSASTSPKPPNSGFQVTSRVQKLQNRSNSSEEIVKLSSGSHLGLGMMKTHPCTPSSAEGNRRTSNISDKSFDEESLIDAYGVPSPVLETKALVGTAGLLEGVVGGWAEDGCGEVRVGSVGDGGEVRGTGV